MTNRKIEYWVIPPESDAEFAANMEAVIETYEKPYNPGIPVLCMDEQPVQLGKETRTPIEPTLRTSNKTGLDSSGSFSGRRRPAASTTQRGCLFRRPCPPKNRSLSVRHPVLLELLRTVC